MKQVTISQLQKYIKEHDKDTWDEFDKLVDEIDEKLNPEDFTRCDLSRPLVDFNEVRT